MFESIVFFFVAAIAWELAAINRNGRKKIEQQAEMIQLIRELDRRL